MKMVPDLLEFEEREFALTYLKRINLSYWTQREDTAKWCLTPPYVLSFLTDDVSPVVRAAVAGNPRTPIKCLEKLSQDTTLVVQCAVAKNPATPVSILGSLANGGHVVVEALLKNPNCPEWIKVASKVGSL